MRNTTNNVAVCVTSVRMIQIQIVIGHAFFLSRGIFGSSWTKSGQDEPHLRSMLIM